MRKILIADGNTKLLAMLESFLQVRDFKVFTTTSAGSIMDLARENQPDLIIMDFEMEEMSAPEVCPVEAKRFHATNLRDDHHRP